MSEPTEENLLTSSKAAKLLGISRSSLLKLLKDPSIPVKAIELPSGHNRFKESEILTYRDLLMVGGEKDGGDGVLHQNINREAYWKRMRELGKA